jgi:putative glycosyltransferase (TIGR04372 family)
MNNVISVPQPDAIPLSIGFNKTIKISIEQIDNIFSIIDWPHLESVVKKFSHRIDSFAFNYKAGIRNYILELISSGFHLVQLDENLCIEICASDIDLLKKRFFSKIELEEIQEFKEFVEMHNLSGVITKELSAQLIPFLELIFSKNEENFLTEKLLSRDINFQRLIDIFKSHYSASSLVNKPIKKIFIIFNNKLFIYFFFNFAIFIAYYGKKSFSLFSKLKKISNYIKKMLQKKIHHSFSSNVRNNISAKKIKIGWKEQILSFLAFPICYKLNNFMMLCQQPVKNIHNNYFTSNKNIVNLSSFLYLYAKYYLNHHKYFEAYELFYAAMKLGNKSPDAPFYLGVAAQLSGQYIEACHAYKVSIFYRRNLSTDCFINLAHVLLATNKENEAVFFLQRGVKQEPVYSMAHQNSAAYYDRANYQPQLLDLLFSTENLLYDAYNLIGERAIHIGDGSKGVYFYGKSISQQKKQAALSELPKEIVSKLKDEYSFNPSKPFRILPYEWVTHIGHIGLLDTYLKLQYLGMANSNCQVLLLAPPDKVINRSYLYLWKTHLTVIEDPFLIKMLFPYQRYFGNCFNGYLKCDNSPGDWTELGAKAHIAWDGDNRPPLIELPKSICDKGWGVLEKMGLKKSDWFVCLHARGSGYHKESRFSMQSHRDSDVSDYFGAIEAITSQGGWVIRMGDHSMEYLPPMKGVIDYAHSQYKSEWMDVFLAAKAKFFIGTMSGLSNLVISLGTPCLLVNCISNYFQLWNNKVLFTIKPLWFAAQQRYLTFSEMISESFRWNLFNINKLTSMGIVPHNNTSNEITESTLEMLQKVNEGKFYIETTADQFLKKECERSGNLNYFGNGKLSESFFNKMKNKLFST